MRITAAQDAADALTCQAGRFIVGQVQACYVCYLFGPMKGVVGQGLSGTWYSRYRKVVVLDVVGPKSPFYLASVCIHKWFPSLPRPAALLFIPQDTISLLWPQGLCSYGPLCLEHSALDLLTYLTLMIRPPPEGFNRT